MKNWLIHHFINDYKNIEDRQVRYAYGQLGSITGIVCNLLLVALKITVGISTNAISVISDGINNLSDCASCIMTLFGNRISMKPADKEHPFGHGRMEYVGSLAVGCIILLAAWQLLQESIHRIQQPSELHFSTLTILLLVSSIFVKVWMYTFDNYIGNLVQHLGLKAAAKDSLNDVLTSLITIAAIVVSRFVPSFPFDGVAGVIVSLIIFKEGYDILKDVIDQILGRPVDPMLVSKMEEIIRNHTEALGVHDLIIHEYGPGNLIGSGHVELDADLAFKKVHAMLDVAEREIEEQTNVHMTLHADPVEVNNPLHEKYLVKTKKILEDFDSTLTCHDFQIKEKEDCIQLFFDVLIPYSCNKTKEEIQLKLDKAYQENEKKVELIVVYDHDYIE